MMHLDYRDAGPIYAQIVENFRTQISTGILRKGEKLPSVRELAAELAINPNTIQRAYRELEARGLIVTVPGKGCFVNGSDDGNQALWQEFDRAAMQLLSRGVSRQELLEYLIQGGKNHAPNE